MFGGLESLQKKSKIEERCSIFAAGRTIVSAGRIVFRHIGRLYA